MTSAPLSATLRPVWKNCENCGKRYSQSGPGRPSKLCVPCREAAKIDANRANWAKNGAKYRRKGTSGGNPEGSIWRSTPNEKRNRKQAGFTLSEEALEKLDRLAEGSSKSAVLEALILGAPDA